MEIQPLLDKILPAMIPAAITGSAYYLLTKKNASMTALILVVIVLGDGRLPPPASSPSFDPRELVNQ